MSVEQIESQVLALPIEERRKFTRWLDEHRDEIEQPSALVQAQHHEIGRRLAEMEADPAMRVPFTQADVEQMFREFADARSQKTSSPAEIKEAILQRRNEVDAHPELLEPWEGTTDRVRARLHEIRDQKAPAR
jgi:hypothetical protein